MKIGFCTKAIRTILFFVFILLSGFALGQSVPLFRIVQNGKIGYVNYQGEVVIEPKYFNGGEFVDGLAPVRLNGLYGYINEKDSFIIQPQFDYANSFCKGIASVYKKGQPLIIDNSSQLFTDTSFISIYPTNVQCAIVVTKSKHFGIINLLTKKLIVDTIFDNMRMLNNGLYTVGKKIHGKEKIDDYLWDYGIIDSLGNFIVPFGKYKKIGEFADGYSIVEIKNDNATDESIQGVIDTKGNLLFQKTGGEHTYMADEIHNGVAVIHLYKYWIPKDKTSSYLSENIYDGYINSMGEIIYNDTLQKYLNDFSCGRTFISNSGRGFKIVGPNLHAVGTDTFKTYLGKGYKNNYVVARRTNNEWGIVDTNGTFVTIESRYDYDINNVGDQTMVIGDFLFFVVEDGRGEEVTGITNLSGKEIMPPIIQNYDHSGFKSGLLRAVINDRLTYIDTLGNIVWQERKTSTNLLKTYNIDYMNRGHFYAYSKTHQSDLGGFGRSTNLPKSITDKYRFLRNKLSVIVNPSEVDSIEGNEDDYYKAMTVYIYNTTDKDVEFNAQDSRLYMNVQAKDNTGVWRNIEYTPMSWCGNSYHKLTLDKNQYWKFSTPVYDGSFKTKLRIEVKYIDPKDPPSKKEIIIYSNEYEGNINPAQFWRKVAYQSNGIMDSYNE